MYFFSPNRIDSSRKRQVEQDASKVAGSAAQMSVSERYLLEGSLVSMQESPDQQFQLQLHAALDL